MVKIFVLIILGWAYFGHSCSPSSANSEIPRELSSDTVVAKTDTLRVISFVSDIQPILQTRCSPCHFTGGKMYEKMPFDKAETILTHTVGILKRIKQEPDAQKIKDFLKQNSK